MVNTKMATIGDAIEKYAARRSTKFDSKGFLLSYSDSIPLSIRAKLANIGGQDRIFVDTVHKISAVPTLATFFLETIRDQEISIAAFLNPVPLRVSSRPGNRNEYVAFIGFYPQVARKGRLVCFNSGLFFADYYQSVIAFEAKGNHFEATVLPPEPRVLLKGDQVIMMK